MKLNRKSEWYELDAPIGEPDVSWSEDKYWIERLEEDGKVVWFGHNTNWTKSPEGVWEYLVGGKWVECKEPIYETLRNTATLMIESVLP